VTATAELGPQAIGYPPRISLRRIVLSSIIGTAVEWYDFFIYATATALVFNKLFFPANVASLSSIAAFATYAGFFCTARRRRHLRPLRR
jgi:MFS transporter, MHS family, shikimate and dehydroshikimate transport protein